MADLFKKREELENNIMPKRQEYNNLNNPTTKDYDENTISPS